MTSSVEGALARKGRLLGWGVWFLAAVTLAGSVAFLRGMAAGRYVVILAGGFTVFAHNWRKAVLRKRDRRRGD